MTNLNVAAEAAKPIITPAPVDAVKQDEVKAPVKAPQDDTANTQK